MIDDSNAYHQLRASGINGFTSWKSFYETVTVILKESFGEKMHVDYNYYGAEPPKERNRSRIQRRNFFNKLRKEGINVYLGECQKQEDLSYIEKGVDILLALDIYQFSVYQYHYLIIFSGDSDFLPAIERAQRNGSHVIAILSKQIHAYRISKIVNEIIWLEDILDRMEQDYIYR
ncbi:NYN domain-containing protein [Paenibacillus sp. FSL P4-0288]